MSVMGHPFRNLPYFCPQETLPGIREAARQPGTEQGKLTQAEKKATLETYHGLLFAHALRAHLNLHFHFASHESADFDGVLYWRAAHDHAAFATVQLKEVPPAQMNSQASLQQIIDSTAAKYADSPDLTVAVYLNRDGEFDPNKLRIPRMSIHGLYVYHAVDPDHTTWVVTGDLLSKHRSTKFSFPEPGQCELRR